MLLGAILAFTLDETLGDQGGHRYTLLKYFPYFWLGVLLADIHMQDRLAPLLAPAAWDLAGLAGLTIFLVSGIFQHWTDGWETPVLDFSRYIGIAGMFGGALCGVRFKAFCGSTWISIIGGACYSFYLTHAQLLKLFTPWILSAFRPANLYEAYAVAVIAMLPIILIGGFLFYVLIERPCMIPNWPQRLWRSLVDRLSGRASVASEAAQ